MLQKSTFKKLTLGLDWGKKQEFFFFSCLHKETQDYYIRD